MSKNAAGLAAYIRRNVAGIYQIRNMATGKRYIGSSIYLRERLRQHALTLYGGSHLNHRLQRDFERHGGENFAFEVLARFWHRHRDLRVIEQGYIDRFKTRNPRHGYNRRPSLGVPSQYPPNTDADTFRGIWK